MNVNGKEMAITLRRDGNLTALPFCNETIRQKNEFYELPATIDKQKQAIFISSKVEIEGCFVSRLTFDNVPELFEILSNTSSPFDIFINRKTEKDTFRNLKPLSFELRANNKEPFYLRVNVAETEKSYVEYWEHNTPDLRFNKETETYLYDGHNISYIVNGNFRTIPLAYRFLLTGTFSDTKSFILSVYFPFSDEFFPKLNNIEKLVIPISAADGVYLELNGLKPLSDESNVDCADDVLCKQEFNVTGTIKVVIKTRKIYREIEL